MLYAFVLWFEKTFLADHSPGIIKMLVKLILYPFYFVAYVLDSIIDWIADLPFRFIHWLGDIITAIGNFLW